MNSIKLDFDVGETIYLDSATRGLAPNLDDLSLISSRDYQHNIFTEARDQSKLYLHTKQALADYIGGEAENIAFLPNRSIAWNIILQSLHSSHTRVRTDWTEDSSLLAPALSNYEVEFIGEVDTEETMIEDTLLIYSSVDPLTGRNKKHSREIANLTIVDSSYDLSYRKIDEYDTDIIIAELSIDLLSPFPIGMIYFKSDIQLENTLLTSGNIASFDEHQIKLRNDSIGFELGTIDINTIRGLQHSIDYLQNLQQHGLSDIEVTRTDYGERLRQELRKLDGIEIIGDDQEASYGSIITISNTIPAHDMALMLDEIGKIQVRSGKICSHIAMSRLELDGGLRLSWHVYNNIEEIDAIIEAITQVQQMFAPS